jgi:hypothetical protein
MHGFAALAMTALNFQGDGFPMWDARADHSCHQFPHAAPDGARVPLVVALARPRSDLGRRLLRSCP